MRIVITGGTGFVGLAVTEALKQANLEVVLFGRGAVPARFSAQFGSIPFVVGDVTVPADLERLFSSVETQAVIHLAAVTPDRDAEMGDPAAVIAVNVAGTANLMRSIVRLSPRPRLILASSVAVYGETAPEKGAYREGEFIPSPTSLYGISKLAAEATAIRLAKLYEIDLAIIRLGPVYGPWEYKTGLRPILSPHAQVVDLWQQGENVVLPRSLKGDWLYSRDAGAGIAAILGAKALNHTVYNLGGGVISSVADWCEELQAFPGHRGWKIAGEGDTPNLKFGLAADRSPLDIERFVADTGFRPTLSGREAAEDYVRWLSSVNG
ncbi:NAD(P)-dependent oxidoreductase [Neorhizobium sp. Rsf11]|uniref:NAD(P)-dependent oxidoreductase n=2 Tax=Neorhizobium TaxID=1525371 RepID=A0ABV0MC99_9HYPH|nr:NAD(P)-dependent oxidoreductase [Neorhizobium petrolearium]MCC2613681.1 NAD(P)-dependent oxidoreductase [Neorhizobium petrolearium]WGI71996.1 NAD(P)-dependent oxidoreductase [Neorhizobium petrolearium]